MYMNEPTPAARRVDEASQEAYELALDCLHDRALQHALFHRLFREQEAAR